MSDKSAYSSLRAKDRKFVEGICAGMSQMEAARFAGSGAKSNKSLATVAARWGQRPIIQKAIEELRALHRVDDGGLWELARKALRELIQDRNSPNARARACELLAKLLGKLQPERHEHVHAHVELPPMDSPQGREELVRLVRVTLRALPLEERQEIISEALEVEAVPAVAGS